MGLITSCSKMASDTRFQQAIVGHGFQPERLQLMIRERLPSHETMQRRGAAFSQQGKRSLGSRDSYEQIEKNNRLFADMRSALRAVEAESRSLGLITMSQLLQKDSITEGQFAVK
jgi:hypothetical protein